MCGRFTQAYSWSELAALYQLTTPSPNLEPHYKIAPTDEIDVIVPSDVGHQLTRMRWGLIPRRWKKSPKYLPSSFKARVETVVAKPMFRDAYRHNRCVIPASGYYEWRGMATGRQPSYYITAADTPVLSMAGLWDRWNDVKTGEPVISCTIIVTAANALTRHIRARMPVVLAPRDVSAWLRGEAGIELLKPAPDNALRMWPQSLALGS